MRATPQISFAFLFVLMLILALGFILLNTSSKKTRAAISSMGVGIVVLLGLLALASPVFFFLATRRATFRPAYELSLDGETQTSGQVVGDSYRWSESHESKYLADIYSSEKEAVTSVAFQCAAKLDELRKTTSSLPPARLTRFPLVSDSSYSTYASILSELVPDLEVSSNDDGNTMELGIRYRRSNSEGTVGTFYVSLWTNGIEHEYLAHSVDKPWVKGEVQFRFSTARPDQYFVAVGQPDSKPGADEKPARAVAAEYLRPLIAAALNNAQLRHHGYARHSKAMDQVTDNVTKELIADRFVQTFDRTIDGAPLEAPLQRDAVLVDCSSARFDQAMVKSLEEVSRGSTRRAARIDEEILLAFGGLSGLLFTVVWGISKPFDRRKDLTEQ